MLDELAYCHAPDLLLALDAARRWPAETQALHVRFLDGDDLLRQRVQQVIECGWNTCCGLPFVFDQTSNAQIRVTFARGGSWSYVGTECVQIPAELPTMQLGWLLPATPQAEVMRVALHEFGHALGFIHPVQSPAFPYQWNLDALYAAYGARGYSRGWVDAQIVRKVDSPLLEGPFDAGSIMLYALDRRLLIPPPAQPIGGACDLSDSDKAMVRAWYGLPRAEWSGAVAAHG